MRHAPAQYVSVSSCLVIDTGSDVTIKWSTRENLQDVLPMPFVNQNTQQKSASLPNQSMALFALRLNR